ncbi:MAG: sialidase family protein [Bacteroidales bacterium]
MIRMIYKYRFLVGSFCFPFSLWAQNAPQIVAKAPSDAYIGLSKMENGEIRHYNYGEQHQEGCFYISSKDNGTTWEKIELDNTVYFADNRNPLTNTMVRLFNHGKGVYCIRYNASENGTKNISKITDKALIMLKPPVFIRGGKRILVATHYAGPDKEKNSGARVLYSDDDGITWKESEKVNTPRHKKEGFHQGVRWNHGAVEPTVIELNDGRIWMIMRTPQDSHYQSFSYDGGETWSTPTPAPFYATITMPTLTRLNDGRLLFVWNNTTPLPELASANGVWDDVFTNRNVLHAAISEDDGKSWIGCRELFLDERRNAVDFADSKGIDKSVHQTQCVETEDGNIVMAIGQHDLHRKIIRFNPAWLYETERSDNFGNGLADWSTFQYYKGIKGHCGYNRKEGGSLNPHPYKSNARVLNLKHIPNDSLLYAGEGALWNFPALKKGSFTTSIRIPENSKGGELILNDRWFNPTDTTAVWFSSYSLPLQRETLGIKDDAFHTIRIEWNLIGNETVASVFVDKQKKPTVLLPLKNTVQHGISYVHFLSAKSSDPVGFDVEKVESKSLQRK